MTKIQSVKKIYLDEVLKNKTPAIISNKYINNLKIPQFVVSNINFEIHSLLNKLHNNLPFKTTSSYRYKWKDISCLVYFKNS